MDEMVELAAVFRWTIITMIVACGTIIMAYMDYHRWWDKKHGPLHDFDLENPEEAEFTIRISSSRPDVVVPSHPEKTLKVTYFVCKRCDKSLALDRRQMDDLPPEMARGCITKEDT